jgi:hypothetical protein
MSTLISDVYDAFRSAGVTEEKACKAAEAIRSETLAAKCDINQAGQRDCSVEVASWLGHGRCSRPNFEDLLWLNPRKRKGVCGGPDLHPEPGFRWARSVVHWVHLTRDDHA